MITQARLIIAGLIIAALLAFGGYVWWTRDQLKQARARVVTAEQTTDLAKDTSEITERTLRTEVVIHQSAERQADAIQSAPGAETVLDPAFRDTLVAGLGVMRSDPKAADDIGSGGSAGGVP